MHTDKDEKNKNYKKEKKIEKTDEKKNNQEGKK